MKKLIFAFACLLFAIPCQARIITVDDDGPADFNNIQAAIDDSNDGDTIIVADGIYTGEGNRDIDFGGKAITVRSTNPNDPNIVAITIIDCNRTVDRFYRGFIFQNGETSSSVIAGLTITNALARYRGAGVYCYGSSPMLTNCTFTGNAAFGDYGCGGGMATFGGSNPILIGCTFRNNTAVDRGGGMGNWDASPTLMNCTFSENSARYGGGMCSVGDRSPTLTNCTFSVNSAGWGGGMCNDSESSPKLMNCTFSYNSAIMDGGAVSNFGYSSPTLNNCIFSGNLAERDGGGMWNRRSSPTLKNCTFSANSGRGRAMYNWEDSRPILTNCILWDGGWEIHNYACTVSVNYSNIHWGWPGIGNIDTDPCFADANNGDYHLKSQAGRWNPNSQSWVWDDVTSPCIDAGNPGCPEANEPLPNGNRRNMGASGGTAEASKSPPNWRSIADLTNDWVVDSNDLRVFVDYWLQTGECIPSDLNRNLFVDFSDFAIFGLQWSYPSASELGMTFHIDDCNMEAGLRWTAAAESNEPRFSVWVEGRYIYFEDQMYANCCPDELGLDKEINGNQIILYEIGYGGLCYCMCYFPITATLGPFEDGTYTVEVYDNYGNSLGVVEVTIGDSTGPGITFQIDKCSLFLAAEQESETRFTATVEGPYIHFEDTMVANCCPDELGLEMTVEDDLITIYETEYTSEGCRCVCFYPVTAMLGPFEPGTYTLEVYEYHDGFIGSTTVVIDPPP